MGMLLITPALVCYLWVATYLLEPVMNISLCVHTSVGVGKPLAEHLSRTSSPVLKVWFCGLTVTVGKADERNTG